MYRNSALVLLAVIVTGCNHQAPHPMDDHIPAGGEHAGHGTSTLMIQTDPTLVTAGSPTTLKLMIHDATGEMVKSFEVVHEEKVHLIIIRDGLDKFAHIHPAIDARGNLTARFPFPTGGTYRLYADYKPPGGKQNTASGELKVAGEAPAAPTLTPDVPGMVRGGGIEALVTLENAKAETEATITFELAHSGMPITDLQPYMGAMGHLVVVSNDGREYIHAHPVDEQPSIGKSVVALQAHLRNAGLYKAWGQFQWKSEVRVIPFVFTAD